MTKRELLEFICEIYQIQQCTPIILKHINKYVTEQRYDYIDIARALSYWVDVLGKPAQPQYGLAIVEYIIDEAKKYFNELKLQKEKQIQAAEIMRKNHGGKIVMCKMPTRDKKPKKHINIEDIK